MDTSELTSWRLAPDVWRSLHAVSLRSVDLALRAIGAGRLPQSVFARIYSLGIPAESVAQTLGAVRGLDSWSTAWTETAQEYLGLSRRETSAGNRIEAERARAIAAMCYHAAQIFELRNRKVRDSCRAWVASLTRQALPVVHPHARHLYVPWRDQQLPVLLELPQGGDGPFGLVVMFNGISQSKEETFQLAPRFLEAGYAVMAIDSPGTGEATSMGPISSTAADIIDGALTILLREGAIDPDRIVLVGASLGGNEAIRIGKRLPHVMAVIAVTPAIQPTAWMAYASPVLVAELADLVADFTPEDVASSFDVTGAAAALQMPVLVFGAGQDVIVPPNESQKLAAIVGESATLVWYPDLGHCLYAAADQWTSEAAEWLLAIEQGRGAGETNAATLAEHGRAAIQDVAYQPAAASGEDDADEFAEYARLLPTDDAGD